MTERKYLARVIGYGSGGEGVARLPDGRAVFIRGAARGDLCEIAVIKEEPRSCRAEILRIAEPSPWRIEPDCPVYQVCGGCDFRHVTYEEELRAKLTRVNDALERIGKLSLCAEEILSTGQTEGYRNKAVFHSALKDGKTVTGFYRRGSHEVCPVERCALLRDELNGALRALREDSPPPGSEVMLRAGRGGFCEPVEEELDGLLFRMSPESFFQVNSGAALLLYQKAREYAALSKDETLVDLYCGVGTLTLFLGRGAGRALGVENNPAAVRDAQENARMNGLGHIEFICADAANWQPDGFQGGCLVVDPPRRGLSPGAARKILELSPARIVYLSCDPATLARDLRLLAGYEARRVCAVDMFPRTANVECCLLLWRK